LLYLSGVVRPDMPAMLTPRMGQRAAEGQLWAADNGRYASPQDYTDAAFLAWLATMPAESCLFATAPDVVGDASATLALSTPMFAPIRAAGYPVALVAQDGLESLPVPWDDFDVLFIGGTTAWKLSEPAHGLAAEAKRRGKWLHMGRVNSLRRCRIAQAMGCDSVDGTFLRFGPDINVARLRGWFQAMHRQPMVWAASQGEGGVTE
jgi:hypothetical protein